MDIYVLKAVLFWCFVVIKSDKVLQDSELLDQAVYLKIDVFFFLSFSFVYRVDRV